MKRKIESTRCLTNNLTPIKKFLKKETKNCKKKHLQCNRELQKEREKTHQSYNKQEERRREKQNITSLKKQQEIVLLREQDKKKAVREAINELLIKKFPITEADDFEFVT